MSPSISNSSSPSLKSSPSSSPSSLRKTDISKLLDIAESAAKMVPVLGNMLEGGIGSLRKILGLIDSMRKCKSECLTLAERAALILASVCTELAQMSERQHVHDRIVNLIDCLLEIEEYMTSLGRTSGLRRIATSSAILAEIAAFNVRLQDAVSVFQIRSAVNTESMLVEIAQNDDLIRKDIASSTDIVVRANSVSTETLLAVLAAHEKTRSESNEMLLRTISTSNEAVLAVLVAQRQPAFPPTTAFDDPTFDTRSSSSLENPYQPISADNTEYPPLRSCQGRWCNWFHDTKSLKLMLDLTTLYKALHPRQALSRSWCGETNKTMEFPNTNTIIHTAAPSVRCVEAQGVPALCIQPGPVVPLKYLYQHRSVQSMSEIAQAHIAALTPNQRTH
ncbi:hypothetical protein C8J56DRAFT_1174942 [Mycena floridula]|nr:hypothetical protein C8J56DRAFT_1174942 [Mycena floridula]